MQLERVAIIGVGLIGGSFALALKSSRVAKHIVGVGRSRRNLEAAVEFGILDEAGTEAAALAHDCGHGPAGHASEEALSPFRDIKPWPAPGWRRCRWPCSPVHQRSRR